MRAVLVHPGPAFSVADVATGWEKALRSLGVSVAPFHTGDAMTYHEKALRLSGVDEDDLGQRSATMAAANLRQLCFDWWPDVVIVVSAFFVPPETYRMLQGRGMKVAVILTESPYEDDNQVPIAEHADLAVVNDPTNLDRFPDGTLYLPHAYDPDLHRPGPVSPDAASDFCFVGTGYPERIKFLEAVDFDGIDVALAGNWAELGDQSPLVKYVAHDLHACCPNDETVRLYQSTKASANIYRTSSQRPELADGWAMGPREVELAACGTFFFTQDRGENRDVLPMLPRFETPDDLSDQLRWWLARPDERHDVAQQARAAVADRTFTANANRLLAAL